MTRFATREEYQAWKASHQSGAVAAGSIQAPSLYRSPAGKKAEGFKDTFAGLPGWAWAFVVACVAIPVVSLGGAIPGAIGAGSAAGCANVAKREGMQPGTRIAACAAITAGAWVLFLTFAVALASATK
jgi:hypothetical protein